MLFWPGYKQEKADNNNNTTQHKITAESSLVFRPVSALHPHLSLLFVVPRMILYIYVSHPQPRE